MEDLGLIPELGRFSRRERIPTPVFRPGEFHGLYSPCGQSWTRHSDFHFRFVIAFLPRRKCLLISWLQSPLAEILEPKKIMSVIVSSCICPYYIIPTIYIYVYRKALLHLINEEKKMEKLENL